MKMDAQLACTDGRYAEAVALYDEIIRALGPMNSNHALSGLDRTKGH